MSSPSTSVPPVSDDHPTQLPGPSTVDDSPLSDANGNPLSEGCPHGAYDEGRNLVVNLDGTSNQFSLYSTNVVEIFSRIIKDERQRAYYNSGIGTYARPSLKWQYLKQWLDHKIDTAIAWHFETIVHAAYEWLSENYMDGDRIFLFGFSRGAYQVRVIAGMIETVGLLHKGNKSQIPFAYELYTSVKDHDGKPKKRTSRDKKEKKLCAKFKASLCHKNVKVHFVGCWDTVSSIGIFRGRSFPETVSGMGHVCSFRHALALDERRVKFLPEYVNGGVGPCERDKGDVKEVWFAGTHSDIGGGSILNEDLENFVAALRWMTHEATSRGLRIDTFQGKWTLPRFSNSLRGGWKVLEILPFRCLSYKDKRSTKWIFHLGTGRQIHDGQLIHQSVIEQLRRSPEDPSNSNTTPQTKLKYTPKAKLPATYGLVSWADLLSIELHNLPSFVEKDPYEMGFPFIAALLDASMKLRIANESGYLAKFEDVLSTIHDFVDDGLYLGLSPQYRYASLLEVPNAGAVVAVALDVVVDYQRALGEKTKVTLVRLLERLYTKVERHEVQCNRLRVQEIYNWVLPFWIDCGFDEAHLEEVCQRLVLLGVWKRLGRMEYFSFFGQHHDCIIFTQRFCDKTKTTRSNLGDKRSLHVKVWKHSDQIATKLIELEGQVSTISPDGCLVAVATESKVTIYDPGADHGTNFHHLDIRDIHDRPKDSAEQQALQHRCTIQSLCFSYSYGILVAGLANGWVVSWTYFKEKPSWMVSSCFRGGRQSIIQLSASSHGTWLAFQTSLTTLVCRARLDHKVVKLRGRQYLKCSLAWSPAEDRLAIGVFDFTLNTSQVEIWDASQVGITHSFMPYHRRGISSLAFRHDGRILAVGGVDGEVTCWDCQTWRKVWDLHESIRGANIWPRVAFSQNGQRLISVGLEGVTHLWTTDTGDHGEYEEHMK